MAHPRLPPFRRRNDSQLKACATPHEKRRPPFDHYKKYKPYPSKEMLVERENLLKRDFLTTTVNEKWVADITYIHTLRDGWCYLASVLDLHTQKIVGYSFSPSMTTDLVMKALDNACHTQQPGQGLILHTDLGTHIQVMNLKDT